MKSKRFLSEEIKSVVNLVQFIGTRVPLTLAGRSYRGNCPLHKDDARQLFVYPGLDQWTCFGACDVDGDVVSFLMRLDNVGYGEALRRIAAQYGLVAEKPTSDPVGPTDPWLTDDRTGTSLFGPGSLEFQRRRKMEQRLERVLDFQFLDEVTKAELLRPTFGYSDDRELVVGNLAYIGKLAYQRSIRYLKPARLRPRIVGILISIPATLQKHVELETPDGQIHTEDASRAFNAGEITWCEGESIYKDTATGKHYPATLLGCSSKGFCLILPEGSPSPIWLPPREPEEIGGRDRPFPYRKADCLEDSYLTLESFFIHDCLDGAIPDFYTDVSGIDVPIEIPKSSPKRHADRLSRKSDS